MTQQQAEQGVRDSLADVRRFLDPADAADLIERYAAMPADAPTADVASLLEDVREAVSNDPWVRGVPPESYAASITASEYLAKWRDPAYVTLWEAYETPVGSVPAAPAEAPR